MITESGHIAAFNSRALSSSKIHSRKALQSASSRPVVVTTLSSFCFKTWHSFYWHSVDVWYNILRYAIIIKIINAKQKEIWSYLNCSHIWLEMPIQAPKMRVLGAFGPLSVIINHLCVNPRLLSYQLQKYVEGSDLQASWQKVWRTHRQTNPHRERHTHTQVNLYSVHA